MYQERVTGDHIPSYKITLLGDAAVGKTSLRKRFMGEGYKQSYGMTIGADFAAYKIEDYTLHIWDLAGQPRFNSVLGAYYNGTLGSMIIFDITRKESFENLANWVDQLVTNLNGKMVPVVIVGNKKDLREDAPQTVSNGDARSYAQELANWSDLDIPYFETSALTGENVDTAFLSLVKNIDKHLGFD